LTDDRRLPLERCGRLVERLRRRAHRDSITSAAFALLMFPLKQAWACLFGATLLLLRFTTLAFYPAKALLARYDFLLIAAVGVQALLLGLKLERPSEAFVILIFHIAGTAMEGFKTGVGSWAYAEASLLRIGGAPLSPSSSGLLKISLPSPTPGSIRARERIGRRRLPPSLGAGICSC
jgi:uncharacterized membrane protein YoaT (DUF817 family)